MNKPQMLHYSIGECIDGPMLAEDLYYDLMDIPTDQLEMLRHYIEIELYERDGMSSQVVS